MNFRLRICFTGLSVNSFLCLLLIAALFSATSASAQSAIARARYGAYPITGKGLKLLKRDVKSDDKLRKVNRARCKNRKLAVSAAACDREGDKLSNGFEKRRLKTSPKSIDTDNDALRDRLEILKYSTNPLVADTDGDGMSDGDEVLIHHTNPRVADTPVCVPPNFDQNGDTTSFDIPAGLSGNTSRGSTVYTQRCRGCHSNAPAEKGTNSAFNNLKASIAAAPMGITNISDASLADLVAYLNRSQTGGSGNCETATPTPGPNSTATPLPTATTTPGIEQGCTNQYFDASGNTTVFGIPASNVGQITRGSSYYSNNCSSCHGARGDGFTFSQMQNSVTGPAMNINWVQTSEYADLTAYANRALANVGCNGQPTPTPTPVITATATSTPYVSECSNEFFDASGNTTQFGNSPLSGNIDAGSSYYGLACSSCHGELGTGFTNSALRSAVTGPLMNINSVSDQHYADLVAFLNRASAPQNCGTPAPTPTPLDDLSAGRIVYEAACQSCHSRAREFRSLSSNGLSEAIAEENEMNGITLSAEQRRVLLAYFHSL